MSLLPMTETKPVNRRGSTILEFAIVAPFLVVALLGVAGFGISLGRYIQALQVCRDVAHMFADGVDFTQSGNQALIVLMAQGSGMTATSGNGVVILSRISTVYQADCDAASYSGSCNNLGLAVFTQRLVVGNTALRSSAFGSPSTGIVDASGNISSSVYLRNTDSSVRTTGFTPLLTTAGLTQGQGDAAWVAELYFSYPDLAFLGNNQPAGMYARFVF
jgi:Flp pilus assembly protein TadG